MTPPNRLGKEFITALISHFSGPWLGETERCLGQGAWLPLCFPLPWGLLKGLTVDSVLSTWEGCGIGCTLLGQAKN